VSLSAVAFLGGVLTILSPCILPVLPFVFLRAGQSFVRSGLPLLLGMAVTFAGVATLAAVGGGWIVQATTFGRWLALGFMFLFGAALLVPRLAERASAPFVRLGSRLAASGDGREGGVGSSLLLGVATGLLWAPCAGPILGLVLTGAALNGASVQTSLLLLAYAAGSAVSLAAALLLGGKPLALMKRSLGAEAWVRRVVGGAAVVAALAIALGLDTGFLARVSSASTTKLESRLLDTLAADRAPGAAPSGAGPAMMSGSPAMTSSAAAMTSSTSAMAGAPAMMAANAAHGEAPLPVEGELPELSGATAWLNSPPLNIAALRGKVVLIDFWTYSCINCIRTLPYVKAWYDKYRDEGFEVIGIHTPEFAFEKRLPNVRNAVADFGVEYPVAVDNDYALWRAFGNRFWPAHYLVDASGRIRYTHFGEGEYDATERAIQQLLEQAGHTAVRAGTVDANGAGAALASSEPDVLSPETYVGYARAENFASPGPMLHDMPREYEIPRELALNEWALRGTWNVHDEFATLEGASGRIAFHFRARDLHLVLAPRADGTPVKFRVRVDGLPPESDHGVDVDAAGNGTMTEPRLYQLVRQRGEIRDRTVEIEFLRSGVAVYAFTFG
jgi:cytochrome c biogenesis protein CcdA/thiol-disulfide isomerase/thioredoxin